MSKKKKAARKKKKAAARKKKPVELELEPIDYAVADVVEQMEKNMGVELKGDWITIISTILAPVIIGWLENCKKKRSGRRIERIARRKGTSETTIRNQSWLNVKRFFIESEDLDMEDFRDFGEDMAQAMADVAIKSKEGALQELTESM